MKFFHRLLDFYIQSSIHVGFAVFCLLKITEKTANLNPNPTLSFGVFFATVLGYNFLKYVEVFWKENYHLAKYYAIFIVFRIDLSIYKSFKCDSDAFICIGNIGINLSVY